MKRLLRLAAVLMVLVLAAIIPAGAVLALDAPEAITIPYVIVAQDTVEAGDFFFCLYYSTVYSGDYPDDIPASQAVIIRLYNTDGETLIATTKPYTISYLDYGYGPQISGIYFSKDDSEALGLVTDAAYVLSISYSEAYVSGVSPCNRVIAPSDYIGELGQDLTRAQFATWLFARCSELEGVRISYPLHGASDTGVMVLSDFGEQYLRGAIPGLQSIAPNVFFTMSSVPEVIYIDSDLSLATDYGEAFAVTDIGVGFENLGDWLGITGSFVAAALFIIIALAFVIFTSYKGWGSEPGLQAGAVVLIMGSCMAGNSTLILTVIMAFLAGIMLLYIMFFSKG